MAVNLVDAAEQTLQWEERLVGLFALARAVKELGEIPEALKSAKAGLEAARKERDEAVKEAARAAAELHMFSQRAEETRARTEQRGADAETKAREGAEKILADARQAAASLVEAAKAEAASVVSTKEAELERGRAALAALNGEIDVAKGDLADLDDQKTRIRAEIDELRAAARKVLA